MRLGIMQPYFFPYTGHFSLIAASDAWVVFDTCQYSPKSWICRNRLRHPAGGPTWMTVPVLKGSIHTRIADVDVLDRRKARNGVLGQLSHFRRAPFYHQVVKLVDQTFDQAGQALADLNLRGLESVCRYIGLPFHPRVCSTLELNLPDRLGPGEWAPAICKALSATDYVNPVGGRELFKPADFAAIKVKLGFVTARPFAYAAGTCPIEPNLSILDALLWNAPCQVLAAVHDYDLKPVD